MFNRTTKIGDITVTDLMPNMIANVKSIVDIIESIKDDETKKILREYLDKYIKFASEPKAIFGQITK